MNKNFNIFQIKITKIFVENITSNKNVKMKIYKIY